MFEYIASGLRLSGRVGNNLENQENEVLAVKSLLHRAGYFDLNAAPEPHGYMTRNMDGAIRAYQGANGLRVDGILNPGGETESALRKIASGGAEDKIPIPRRKPSRLDATGRMIREDQPKTYKYLDRVPKPKTDLFKGSRAQEWEDWNALLEQDKELGSAQRKAFSEIYAFEGGMRSPAGGTAFAGIVQSTLNGLKNNGFLPELSKEMKTKDLDQKSINQVYKAYFNDLFKGAAKTAKLTADKGYTLLGTIGDDQIAAAFADTIFRDDPELVSVPMIQGAINQALSLNHVPGDRYLGVAGTQTFNKLRSIAKDPKKKRVFLDTLGDLRDQKFTEPGDPMRNEHFRFRQ